MEINFASRECNVKIVYYGPGLSGKTTNLEVIHQKAPEGNRGKLTALATDLDRTLYFDYMPLELGKISGLTVRMRLFTVPGQVYYNSTRKIVLRCVDGVVFVADSQEKQKNANLESLENLKENLLEHGLTIEEIPLVLQYNKRDLPNIMPIEMMEADLNSTLHASSCPAIAPKGDGVFQSLKMIANLTMAKVEENIRQKPRLMTTESQRIAPSLTKDGKLPEKVSFVPPKKKSDIEMTQRRTRFSITGKWKKEEKPAPVTLPKIQEKAQETIQDGSHSTYRMAIPPEKKAMDSTSDTNRSIGTTIHKAAKTEEISSLEAKKVLSVHTEKFTPVSEEKKNFFPQAQMHQQAMSSQENVKKGIEESTFRARFGRMETEKKEAFKQEEQQEKIKKSIEESAFRTRFGRMETEKKEASIPERIVDIPKPKIPDPVSSVKPDRFSMPLFQGSLSNSGSNTDSIGQKASLRISRDSNIPSPSTAPVPPPPPSSHPLSFSNFLERKKEQKRQNQAEEKG